MFYDDESLTTVGFSESTSNGKNVSVSATGTVTVVDWTALTGAVLTVNGIPLTEGVENDWVTNTANGNTAGSLADAIALTPGTGCTASNSDNVITVTAAAEGADGNLITLATSDAVNLTISGDHLSGGVT